MLKKNKLINMGLGISCCTLIGLSLLFCHSSTLKLNESGSKLKWEFNKDYLMENKEFQLYLNDEAILTTTDYECEDYKQIDLVSPVSVSGYKHEYYEDGVNIAWDKTDDMGTLNNYVLKVIDSNNKSIKKSNTLIKEYTAGFKTYKVYMGDKLINETTETSIFINNYDLIEGVNAIKVEALDNNNNSSSSSYEFVYYKLNSRIDKNILYPLNKDTSQKYNYKLKIDEKDEIFEFTDVLDTSLLFTDNNAPSKPTITYSIKDNKLLCLDYSSQDYGSEYSYKITGLGSTLNNKVYSSKIKTSNTQGIKGYYYYFGEEADYNVGDKDSFTDEIYLEIPNLEHKIYYLHMVAVDNAGNLSEQIKCKIENKKPVINTEQSTNDNQSANNNPPTNNQSVNNNQLLPVDEKMSLIKDMCSKVSTVTDVQYDKRLKSIYDYIPTKVLTEVKNDGLKLKYITGNLRQYLINNLGIDYGMEIWGIYRPRTIEIYVTMDADIKSTIHEIGHAWDYTTSGYTKSYLNDFYNIYLEEKNQMFGANNYFAKEETEYFAECFALYLMNPNSLKTKAPKTYNYFKENL